MRRPLLFGTLKVLYSETPWKTGVRLTVRDTVLCWPTIWSHNLHSTRKPSKVLLLIDNAHLHMAGQTVETIKQSDLEVLESHTNCPDIVASDYHQFASLKDALRCHRNAGRGTSMVVRPTTNLLLGGNTQDCGPLDQVYRNGRRLCRKLTYLFNPCFC